jgi:SAM-dependent methyltransferase
MDRYGSDTYGRSFADVYDEWYGDLDDLAVLIELLAELADGGPVCELGVGTGRIAIPLAATGVDVIGVDASSEMLARLVAQDPLATVTPVLGDMVDDIPTGPFSMILIAFNTLFNLTEPQRQADCVKTAAQRLRAGGCLVIDGIVPEVHEIGVAAGLVVDDVSIRELCIDKVVLSIARHHLEAQMAEGQFIEFTETGGVRLRPWKARYSSPDEIDAMAHAAGLALEYRWASPERAAFSATSRRHISVYRLGSTGAP